MARDHDDTRWTEMIACEDAHGTMTAREMTFRAEEAAGTAVTVQDLPTTVILKGGEPLTSPSAAEGHAPVPEEKEAPLYDVLDEIGRGGMGVIVKAHERAIGRKVALKLALEENPQAVSLFLSEARVTGRLEHANIVPVHALGCTADGTPYLALKLIQGHSWMELLRTDKGRGHSLKEHIQILLGVCNAMAYAHEQGIVHRDLKPENVMVGKFGQVFVMDWGLAVSLGNGDEAGVVRAREVQHPAGTPAYMAPELALGLGEQIDQRTDVYLLGACLHEAVTGSVRHCGTSLKEVLMSAVESIPYVYAENVPRELADICNRAMAKDPADRFPDVLAFSRALQAFLEHAQALVLVQKAREKLQLVRELVTGEGTEARKQSRSLQIHDTYGEARFALQHALEIWSGATEAREALQELNRIMVLYALDTEDLSFAERLAKDLEDAEVSGSVEALRARLEERDKELHALREGERQRDWSAISRSLGTMLLATALGGGAAVIGSSLLRHVFPGYASPLNRFLVWIIALAPPATIVFVLFRKVRDAGRLISLQTVGTWGGIAVGCLGLELIGYIQGRPIYAMLPMEALMLGVGLAAMAFQTRLSVLLAAAPLYPTALVLAAYPTYAREILGAVAAIVIGGLGVAMRKGLRLQVTPVTGEKGL